MYLLRALLHYLKLPRVASHCLHKILIIILKGTLVISRAYHYSPRPLPDPRPTPSSRLALALGIARRPVPARAVTFTKAATAAAALARRRVGLPSPALPCSYPSDRCPARRPSATPHRLSIVRVPGILSSYCKRFGSLSYFGSQ